MGGRDTKNNSEPTPATVKRLFALSRNRCAFNDCNTPLVRESKVTGKVCHIKAAQKGGPRYDPSQSSDERRGFGNLVLLCGECHDVIDDPKNSEKYSVSVLTRMKEDHEQQAETTLTNEMTEAFVHSARASVSVGSMQESAIANLEAPNNSGVLTQLVGNFHGPVFVGGSPTSPPATAAEAEPTLISLSGRLFRGRFQSMTSSTWVVALHSAIGGGGELDLASTAAWFHRVAKHYVALARPGVAREFVGPPEFHREGTAILATLAVRPEVARTSVTLIGRDLDLTRIGEGGGLTPGGLHDVPRVLRQVLSAGVGEVNLQEGSGSFISAYARTFAADPALLADLLALEIARLAFITADGATKPALTFVRGVNSITITRADDLLVAHLDLDLMGVGSWSGQVEIFVSDELGSEVQKALDAVGESMRERCSTCGLPAMGTPRDFYECGNCGAVAPKPKMVEVSPAQARRTLKRGQNYT